MWTSMVLPPDTSDTTAGGVKSGHPMRLAYRWPSRWFTPMSGTSAAHAAPFANATPTTSAPTSPGAYVTATAERSRQRSDFIPRFFAATSRHSSHTPQMASMCLRLAISGTTPPKRAWKSIWLATTSEASAPSPSTIAAAVSSHEDSIARMSGRDTPAMPTAVACTSCEASTCSSMPATSRDDSSKGSAAPTRGARSPCMISASSRSE